MGDLLNSKVLHHGRLLWLFPSDDVLKIDKKNERPEHIKFSERYGSAMKRLLKFKPEIQNKVDETLNQIASKMDLDVKEVLFIGIHNNRYKVDKTKDNKNQKALKEQKPF